MEMLVHNEPTVVTKNFYDVNSACNFIHPITTLITALLKCIRFFVRYRIDFLIIRLFNFDLVMQTYFDPSGQ